MTQLPMLPTAPEVSRVHTPYQFSEALPLEALPGDTIREIADRQNFHLPHIAILNGDPIMRADWDYALEAEDLLIFVTLPSGDGVKDVFRVVLQIAITIGASYLLGPAGAGLTGWAYSGAVLATTVAGSYLVNALLPPSQPSVTGFGNGEQASPTYSLTPQGNQARLGSVIPKLYGETLVVPDFAAQPYTEYAGNDLYLYQLFSIDSGLVDVGQIRIADTNAWDKDNGYTGNFSDIEFEIRQPGQEITLFPVNVENSTEVSGQTMEGPNGSGDVIGAYTANTAGTTATTLAIDVSFPGGAGHINDDGSIAAREVIFRHEAREIDDLGNPIGDWFLLAERSESFATRTAQRKSYRFDVTPGRYEVKGWRINNQATDSRDWDTVNWDGLRAYLTGNNTRPCMTLAMRARATNQLSSQASRQISVVATSMLPVWDGVGWTAPTATRSIAAIAADILRNDTYGADRPDDRIDIEKLMALEETWASRGDVFDGVFDSNQSCFDVLSDVLRVGRARPVEVGDTVTFVRDEPATAPKMLLTPRQMREEGISIDYDFFNPTSPDDVIVEFFDARTWRWNEVRCALPGSSSGNPTRLKVKGITDRTRAWRYGIYMAAVNFYRREYITAPVEMDGRILLPMDLVPVSHPLPLYGRAADVIAYNAGTRTLTLSQKAMLTEGTDNYVKLRKRDGAPWGPVLITDGAASNQIVMDETELAAVIADQGDLADFLVTPDIADALPDDMEPTVAVLGHDEEMDRETRLVGVRYEGGNVMRLTLVGEDDRVHTADEGDPPAEADPPVLPATPDGPEIKSISVTVRGSRFAPELTAGITPAPGALSYIWQLSYDHLSWRTLQDGGYTTWEGPVEATTCWLRVTPIGAVAGAAIEWYADLTATEAVPAAVSGLSVTNFTEAAWIKFTLPDEDGLDGVIAKVSETSGFDPEAAGTVVYDDVPVGRVSVALTPGTTLYARVAAYNRYGKAGLNWSSELELVPQQIASAAYGTDVLNKLGNAGALEDGVVFRLDSAGRIAGQTLISGGAAGAQVIAAFLADVFYIADPTVAGGNPFPAFIVEGGVVKINTAFIDTLTAENFSTKWGTFGTLKGSRIESTDGEMVTDYDNKYEYILE